MRADIAHSLVCNNAIKYTYCVPNRAKMTIHSQKCINITHYANPQNDEEKSKNITKMSYIVDKTIQKIKKYKKY